jgi:hypothetical protein
LAPSAEIGLELLVGIGVARGAVGIGAAVVDRKRERLMRLSDASRLGILTHVGAQNRCRRATLAENRYVMHAP